MDDVFSFDPSPSLILYPKYNFCLPPKQVALLTLWDKLGIPHEVHKQLADRTLTVTGIDVDPAAMTLKLPDEMRTSIVKEIQEFLNKWPNTRTLRELRRLLGDLNWRLEVKPLLRPALLSLQAKTAGLTDPKALIPLTKRIRRDLQWLADHFARSDSGVQILDSLVWGYKQADLVIYCDACLEGMAYYVPAQRRGFASTCPTAPSVVNSNIFWFEALTVLAALEWAAKQRPTPRRLAILTDNANTVQIFNSLRGKPGFDELLLCACSTLMESGIDLRVWHVPGEENVVADALSRGKTVPGVSVERFVPPSGRFSDDLA